MKAANQLAANIAIAGDDAHRIASTIFEGSANSIFALELLLDCLERIDSRVRLIVRRDSLLAASSDGAEEIFASASCLALDHGHVFAVKKKHRRAFSDVLKVEHSEIGSCALPCSLMDGHLLLRSIAFGSDSVLITITKAAQFTRPLLPDLMDVFRLTHTEAIISTELFEGKTPQEIAEEHGNSIHTIRAHIRRCYDKLGVTCREELWHKLNQYRVN